MLQISGENALFSNISGVIFSERRICQQTQIRKSAPSRVPGLSQNGFAEICEPVPGVSRRNFRNLISPLSRSRAIGVRFLIPLFFAFAHSVAYRPRVSSIRIWQALSFSFTYVSFFGLWPRKLPPAGGIGGRGFRPCKHRKNVHFCDACTFLSLAETPFLSQPPDNVVHRFAPSKRLS